MPTTNERIMWLLSVFDNPQSSFFVAYYRGSIASWSPEAGGETAAFGELTAPENREALRKWYGQCPSINPGAEAFRRILETAIGERLPVGEYPNKL